MRTDALKALTLLLMSLVLAVATARPAVAQVEIEKVLRRLDGTVITQLDVRQARLLGLFPDASTDARVLRELENRHLILNEVSLFPPTEPDPQAVSTLRAAWTARVGAGADLSDRLTRAGMSAAALDAWFRDDLRMTAYMELRWGAMPEVDRPAMIDAWISDMRQRAGLR